MVIKDHKRQLISKVLTCWICPLLYEPFSFTGRIEEKTSWPLNALPLRQSSIVTLHVLTLRSIIPCDEPQGLDKPQKSLQYPVSDHSASRRTPKTSKSGQQMGASCLLLKEVSNDYHLPVAYAGCCSPSFFTLLNGISRLNNQKRKWQIKCSLGRCEVLHIEGKKAFKCKVMVSELLQLHSEILGLWWMNHWKHQFSVH